MKWSVYKKNVQSFILIDCSLYISEKIKMTSMYTSMFFTETYFLMKDIYQILFFYSYEEELKFLL